MATRAENSARNIFAAWGGQAIFAVSSFVVRAVFVSELAREYVGLESLFASVLTILALADLGIGSAIVFSLYEPLAKGDKEMVKSLMRLFKRAYIAIGAVIIALGALLAPHIELLTGPGTPDIPFLELYFFCFVLNTGISYFFSYKGSLLTADQKSYIVYMLQYGFQIVMCCFQVAILLLFHDYLLYLVCMIASTLFQNVATCIVANRMYPYLREKDVKPLKREDLSVIKKNVVGLVMHKFAGAAAQPVGNLIITNFVSLGATAIYGNYLLIINALTRILDKVFDSLIASVGNLGVCESSDRQYEVFRTTFFVNGFLYTVVTTGLLCAINPFIEFWVGADWQFPAVIVMLIALQFFARGIRSACQTFTSAYGLYWHTRWKAVIEAVLLPVLSLGLAIPFGVAGVIAAGAIVPVVISAPYEAWAVYRHGIHQPLRRFFVRYALYFSLFVVLSMAAYGICSSVPLHGVAAFFVDGAIGVAVSAAGFLLVLWHTRERREFFGLLSRFLGKLLRR